MRGDGLAIRAGDAPRVRGEALVAERLPVLAIGDRRRGRGRRSAPRARTRAPCRSTPRGRFRALGGPPRGAGPRSARASSCRVGSSSVLERSSTSDARRSASASGGTSIRRAAWPELPWSAASRSSTVSGTRSLGQHARGLEFVDERRRGRRVSRGGRPRRPRGAMARGEKPTAAIKPSSTALPAAFRFASSAAPGGRTARPSRRRPRRRRIRR